MKFILSVLMWFLAMGLYSQSSSLFIDSLTITPAYPGSNDSIIFIAYTRHPTTGSSRYDRLVFFTDTTINLYSCWSQGPFLQMEYVNDTFKLSPLTAGNYRARFLYKSLLPWELDSVDPCLTNPYYDSAFLSFFVIGPNVINTWGNGHLIDLYPNPATRSLNIQLTEKSNENPCYKIVDAYGRILLQEFIDKPNAAIDVSTLLPGLYFLQLTNGRQRVVKRFVKQ